jgi:hypothetical protein
MTFAERIERYKKRLVIRALQLANGHIRNAAEIIGMHAEGLRLLVKRCGLEPYVKDYRAIGHPGKRGSRGPQKNPCQRRGNRGNAAWRELGA